MKGKITLLQGIAWIYGKRFRHGIFSCKGIDFDVYIRIHDEKKE